MRADDAAGDGPGAPRPAPCGLLRRLLLSLPWLASPALAMAPSPLPARRLRWVAFYGEQADEALLSAYDIVVLDPMFRGAVAEVGARGARVCAYLSLGEVRLSDPFAGAVDPSVLLAENPAWPGTRRVDVRRPSWRRQVVEELIPAIAARGFNGLMLDTLDTPPHLEQVDKVGHRGMHQAAIDLVRAIRAAHPGLLLLMNRGYALLPELVGSIDGIIAESLLTGSEQQEDGSYRWNERSNVELQLSLLAPARGRIPILSLDYSSPADPDMIGKICEAERALGHHPSVATRTLDTIIPCPGL